MTYFLASEMQVEVTHPAQISICLHPTRFPLCQRHSHCSTCCPQTPVWTLFWCPCGFTSPHSSPSRPQSMDPGLQNPLHRQLLPGLFLDLCIQVQPMPLMCAPLGLQGLGQSLDVGTGEPSQCRMEWGGGAGLRPGATSPCMVMFPCGAPRNPRSRNSIKASCLL